MIPEEQALETLRTAFSLGVNIVHAAPDYEGSLDLVARAVRESQKEIIVCSQGYGDSEHMEYLFQETCRKLGKESLEMFGLACIDDRELLGENVWGPGGQIEFLQKKKRAGQIRHLFCTTHGSAAYMKQIISKDVFDVLFFAFNPLGQTLLTYNQKDRLIKERLDDNEEIIRIAAAANLGIMIMKPLAGGLLCHGKAFPPKSDLIPVPELSAGDCLHYLLTKYPEITCVMPGTASPVEARENAMVGVELGNRAELSDTMVEKGVENLKSGLCSRCGDCEKLCSKQLPISWLFRAAYVHNSSAMVFETLDNLQYRKLHHWERSACATCYNRTCRCTIGLDIPARLCEIHEMMMQWEKDHWLPAITELTSGAGRDEFAAHLFSHNLQQQSVSVENPRTVILKNAGYASWVPAIEPYYLNVRRGKRQLACVMLRGEIPPGENAHFSFLLNETQTDAGELVISLQRGNSVSPAASHPFFVVSIKRECLAVKRRLWMRALLQKFKTILSVPSAGHEGNGARPEYAVHFLSHTIPREMGVGQVINAQVVLQNLGWKTWRCDSAVTSRVELVLRCNGVTVRTIPLPLPNMTPDAVVIVPVELLAPIEIGTHILSMDLVEQTVTLFEDRGATPLHLLVKVQATTEVENDFAMEAPSKFSVRYLEHNLPKCAPTNSRLGAWLRVRNTGSLLWQGTQIETINPVDLLIEIDDRIVSTVHLPVPRVRTGETVTVYFTVPLPQEPGTHILKLSLIRQNDSFFAEHGVIPFIFEITTLQEASTLSAEYFEKAMQMNSWFYMPSHGVVRNSSGSSFPVFARKAKGCTLWDVEGNSYIDYTMGWGCNLLGYSEERVNKSVISALEDSAILPLPHPLLIEVSEMLCENFPSAELTAFGKNGSDVCSLAARLARLATGHRKILVCGYHGFQDWFAELAGFAQTGVPDRAESLIYRFRFNDLDSFRTLLQCHGQDLAAVMLEPSGPGEDAQGPSKEADAEFLRTVADETRRLGAVLIFDEIITGFRYQEGSAQKHTNVIPDLTCLGKALGNGMPIAALVGRRDIMTTYMHRTFYGPTFKDEILSLAAAKTCLGIYRTEPVSQQILDFGDRMIRDANAICQSLDLPAVMAGPAFRFAFHFQEQDAYRLLQLRTLYQQELMKRGVLTYNGTMLPSYAHGEQAFQQTMEALQGALEVVRRAFLDGNLYRFIEMPLISP